MITGKKLAKKVDVEFPKAEVSEGNKKRFLFLVAIFIVTVLVAFGAARLIYSLFEH